MDLYLSILKLFLQRDIYEKYKDVIDKEHLRRNFPEILRVFNSFDKLWSTTDANTVSIVDLAASLYGQYPGADKGVFEPLWGKIDASEADNAVIEEYLSVLNKRIKATKLAFIALDYAEGRTTIEAFSDAVREAGSNPADEKALDDEEFVTDDIELLYEKAVKEGGLNWRLQSLRRSLGPLRKGDFGFVFARPETGKTTFLASECTWMAGQTDRPVLWFNNEEQGEKVGIRLYEACLGAPLERILGDRKRAKEEFYKRTRRNIKIRDDSNISRRGIEKLCQLHKPALIVIDQLDKVKGFDAEREDLLLGTIYQWARELAKGYAPVIGVSQSDGSGEGVKWLNMGNVANAKTAKQAEADWILGIGQSWEDAPNIRGFTICKNKLIGGEESVAGKRHARFEVLIEPEIGRYKDTI